MSKVRIPPMLRDKLDVLAHAQDEPSGKGVLPRAERFEDAVAALIRLGYSAAQAQDAVRKVAEGTEGLTLEDLVRRALARLGKATVGAR
jgi:Holliday junction resolvasome RuvABC DNA-binding subunit